MMGVAEFSKQLRTVGRGRTFVTLHHFSVAAAWRSSNPRAVVVFILSHLFHTFTMRLLASVLSSCLILWSSSAYSAPGTRCVSDDFLLHPATLKTAKVTLPVLAHYCYRDTSGDYVVYLTGSADSRIDGKTLSDNIGAYLFKINAGPTLEAKGTVSDGALGYAVSVQWWTTLTELTDIDGDGLVDPILVYRLYDIDDKGETLMDPYRGRLKIIIFHRGAKAAIRAVTGGLDDERSTTASEPYFKLPRILQTHIERKMERMFANRQFAFDGGSPSREKK